MKKFILILSVAGALSGCKGNGANLDAPAFGQGDAQSKDITDTSSCVGIPVVGTSVFGSWVSSTKNSSQGTREDVTITVQHTSLTATAICTGFGTAHTVSVTVPCVVTNSAIKTTAADSQQTNVNPQCTVSIPMATMNYTLVGNCLALKMNGKTTTMVRSGL